MTWHAIADPNDPDLDKLAAEYHIHPLHLEDCRHRDQRGKVEEGPGYVFTVLKPVEVAPNGSLTFQDLDVFISKDWVITVQEGGNPDVARLIEGLRKQEGSRPDQILYRICDGIVDSYLPLIDQTDDVIDELEVKVLENPTPGVLSRIFEEKRKLLELRRILGNTRDVAAHLYRTEQQLIGADLIPFLRDIYDHVARNLDLVETQRDLLTGTMDVYLSSVANRTNEVMKVLTILGTIALPILVVSGFFGMNTKGMPFENLPHGTAVVTGIMAASTILLLTLFRRFRWF